MIVKTPKSQKGSTVPAEERAEGRGGGRGEGGKRRRVQARSTLESTAPKVRSRSREGVSLNEALMISPKQPKRLRTTDANAKKWGWFLPNSRRPPSGTLPSSFKEIEYVLYDRHQKGKMMIVIVKTSGSQVDSQVAEGNRREGGGRTMRDLHKDT